MAVPCLTAVIFLGNQTLKILAPHMMKGSSEILQLTEKASQCLFIPWPVLLLTRGHVKVLLVVV